MKSKAQIATEYGTTWRTMCVILQQKGFDVKAVSSRKVLTPLEVLDIYRVLGRPTA